jgi:glutaredoxin
MIEKIYGTPGCVLCLRAKKMYPDAQYINFVTLDDVERNSLINKIQESGQTSAPILVDAEDKLISHVEAGIS